jgi:hypothetical protein
LSHPDIDEDFREFGLHEECSWIVVLVEVRILVAVVKVFGQVDCEHLQCGLGECLSKANSLATGEGQEAV